jgi:CBS domain-containing protein
VTTVRELMTTGPVMMPGATDVAAAAKRMRTASIGDVLVVDGGELHGIVTDRDIVTRVVADGGDASATTLAEIASDPSHTVAPDDGLDRAVELLRTHAVRRIPVVDAGTPVGVLAIGDLAVALDADSALADLSASPAD